MMVWTISGGPAQAQWLIFIHNKYVIHYTLYSMHTLYTLYVRYTMLYKLIRNKHPIFIQPDVLQDTNTTDILQDYQVQKGFIII